MPSPTRRINRPIGSHCVLDGDLFWMGMFNAPPDHPRWRVENCFGPAGFVFPRTTVEIEQADRPSVIADPTVVMLYGDDQLYRARCISESGDQCEWIAPTRACIRNVLTDIDPELSDRGLVRFRHSHAPCSPQMYLLQRQVFEHVITASHPDRFWVEEMLTRIVGATIAHAYSMRGERVVRAEPATDLRKARLAADARAWLADSFRGPVRLTALAADIGASVFHLCRVFKARTGGTLHGYLTRLRLAKALEGLVDPQRGIAQLALEVGFSSQSHFTDAFRRKYGVTPAAWRKRVTRSNRPRGKPMFAIVDQHCRVRTMQRGVSPGLPPAEAGVPVCGWKLSRSQVSSTARPFRLRENGARRDPQYSAAIGSYPGISAARAPRLILGGH